MAPQTKKAQTPKSTNGSGALELKSAVEKHDQQLSAMHTEVADLSQSIEKLEKSIELMTEKFEAKVSHDLELEKAKQDASEATEKAVQQIEEQVEETVRNLRTLPKRTVKKVWSGAKKGTKAVTPQNKREAQMFAEGVAVGIGIGGLTPVGPAVKGVVVTTKAVSPAA